MKNNKIKPSVKVALASTLVATSTVAIAYAGPKIAKNNAGDTENKFVLDVENIDGDTVKVSLDNIEDIPRALQFSLKLDGVVLKEANGRPVIRDLVNKNNSDKIITDYSYNKDTNVIDVLITAEDNIPKIGNEIEVFELDIEADSKNQSRNYTILPEENSEYKYVSNTNKEYVKSVSVANTDLALNTAPTIERTSEGYIEVNEGKTLLLTKDVLASKGIVVSDAENDEVTLEVKNASDEVIKEFKGSNAGIYDLYITAIDSFGERSEVLNVQVKVNAIEQGPVITRDGKDLEDVTINAGEVFDLMKGIKAVDVNGNTVDVTVESDKEVISDPEEDSEYIIKYTAIDAQGRTTVKEIKLTVKANKAPVILGVKDHTLTVGDKFDPEAGVTVEDEDDDIELVVNSNVNTSIAGEYRVSYSATDSGNKTTMVQSRVVVNPKIEEINSIPVINASDRVIQLGDEFDPLKGVTATDAEDGPISKIDVVENNVDINKEGSYTVKYSVTDSCGAKATKTITVTVKRYNILAESITIDNKINSLYVGGSKILTATINKEADVRDIHWTTSDENIASIEVIGNSAKVIAKGKGKVTITAKTIDGSNKADSVTINIVNHTEVVPDFINDIIDSNVVIPVSGDATADSPLEMEVQNITVEKFDEFLEKLEDLNPTLEEKYEDGNFTVYRIRVEKKSGFLRLFRFSKTSEEGYIELRVQNDLDNADELKSKLETVLDASETPEEGNNPGDNSGNNSGSNSGGNSGSNTGNNSGNTSNSGQETNSGNTSNQDQGVNSEDTSNSGEVDNSADSSKQDEVDNSRDKKKSENPSDTRDVPTKGKKSIVSYIIIGIIAVAAAIVSGIAVLKNKKNKKDNE